MYEEKLSVVQRVLSERSPRLQPRTPFTIPSSTPALRTWEPLLLHIILVNPDDGSTTKLINRELAAGVEIWDIP